jgi:hypothetical protein
MAEVRKIKVNDITRGSKQAEEEAWLAVAELTSQYNVLLAKIDADSADTGGDANYGTLAALIRQIVV